MNKKLFVGGLVLALVGLLSFILYVRRFEAERSGGEPVQILVVKNAAPRGKTIADDMLSIRSVPIAYVEDRCIKAAEREKVLGLRLAHPLGANQAIMWSDFVDRSDEQKDLSSKIAPGYRALYVKGIREDQGSALVRPGDFVDIISTMPESAEPRAPKVAVVVLQKVMVLANGMRTSAEPLLPDPDDKSAKPAPRDQGLTLALSLQQAQALAVAGTRGYFSVALRSPDDERTYAALPAVDGKALAHPPARLALKTGADM